MQEAIIVVDERSRHQLYRRLEEVLGAEAATTLIEHLPPVGWADVATRHDLMALEQRMELRFDRIDDRFARATAEGFGAFILGRNMFGPAGDDWGGPDWKGWWGDNPPYHAPTFILTHHARAPIVMEGGTTFHFVTGGIEAALARAKAAAGDLDVKVGGGVSTVRQHLLAGAIDEMHLAVSPVVLGRGEPLFAGIDLPGLGYQVTETVPTELATHVVLTR